MGSALSARIRKAAAPANALMPRGDRCNLVTKQKKKKKKIEALKKENLPIFECVTLFLVFAILEAVDACFYYVYAAGHLPASRERRQEQKLRQKQFLISQKSFF